MHNCIYTLFFNFFEIRQITNYTWIMSTFHNLFKILLINNSNAYWSKYNFIILINFEAVIITLTTYYFMLQLCGPSVICSQSTLEISSHRQKCCLFPKIPMPTLRKPVVPTKRKMIKWVLSDLQLVQWKKWIRVFTIKNYFVMSAFPTAISPAIDWKTVSYQWGKYILYKEVLYCI